MKDFFEILKKMALLEWHSVRCLGPSMHDRQLSIMETGGEKTRWMMAFASLRSYSFAAWLLLLVVLYFTTGDLISLPMSKFIQSVDGQEYDWIFWLGDRGLVGLLFGLGVSVPVALIARFVACRSLIVSTVISVFLLLLAVLAVRAGLSSVVFSFAMFVGLFAVYSVNGFCKTCNWKKCVVSGTNDEAVSTHAAIEKNIINQTVKWRSIVSLCFVLLFLIFSFAWYSYLPWILSTLQFSLQNSFQGGGEMAMESGSLLLSHGRVVQWFVSAVAFLILETFAQMIFFHFYYQFKSRAR